MGRVAEEGNMKHVPGIALAGRPPTQTACIAGTGIEVFEVVKVYYAVDKDWERLRGAFHWLSDEQLRAALLYAELHPRSMRERLAAEDAAEAELERLWHDFPATAPTRA